jgi:hypothetical protein
MAARKISAAAMAVAVAVVALLVVAATANECGVNKGQVMGACLSYCGSGSRLGECCGALRNADMVCLCRNYWGRLQGTSYARCAMDIQSKCGLSGC